MELLLDKHIVFPKNESLEAGPNHKVPTYFIKASPNGYPIPNYPWLTSIPNIYPSIPHP